jgi:hypothetical protein
MMRRAADMHGFKYDVLVKLLGIVSFTSDAALVKGWTKDFIQNSARNLFARDVMNIRAPQVQSHLVILSNFKLISLHDIKAYDGAEV